MRTYLKHNRILHTKETFFVVEVICGPINSGCPFEVDNANLSNSPISL
jgi:hypothetical protein